jgi:hypothetical protein
LISRVEEQLRRNKSQFKPEVDLWENIKKIKNDRDKFLMALKNDLTKKTSIARGIMANQYYDQTKKYISYQD